MPEQNPTQMIPLARLVKSAENARKTPPTARQQAELKADIAARGLLQNLVVHKGSRGRFEVSGGGRRLDALQELQKDGKLPKAHKVPCFVRGDDAREVSVAENLQRVAMHPCDEFEAFAELVDAGQAAGDVARRFGFTETHVRQRLKLGRVALELRQAYRDEEMSLEVLQAFTVSGDMDRQRAVWEQVKGHYQVSPYSVRRLLTENTVSMSSPLGRFVGLEAYEQAGGTVSRDLFSDRDDGYMDDPKLVRELAHGKLAEEAVRLEQSGWKWARPMLEPGYGFATEFDRIYPAPVDAPAELVEELARVEARFDEIEATADEDWTDALADESEDLDLRRERLKAGIEEYAAFSDEDRARAGCIVTVGPDGTVEVHAGLIPRDEPGGVAGGGTETAPSDGGTAGAGSTARSPVAEPVLTGEQEVRKACGFSQVHIDDLKAHRLQIAKAHLARDYKTAFDAALFSLCIGAFRPYHGGSPLDLRLTETPMRSSLDDLNDTPADRMLTARRDGLPLAWLDLPADEAFAALCALSAKDKQALFAWCAAQSLHGQLSFEDNAKPVVERIGERLKISFAKHFRPTAGNYWSRVRMDHARAVGGEILGDRWARDQAKAKKAQLSKSLDTAFAAGGTAPSFVTAKARGKAARWVPEGFAFAPRPSETDAPAEAAVADGGPAGDMPNGGPATGSEPDTAVAEDLPEFLTGDPAAEAAA